MNLSHLLLEWLLILGSLPTTSVVQLKAMVESSLLSKDEPLTPNIDKVMRV